MRPTRSLGLLAALLIAMTGCAGPAETRLEMMRLDAQWRLSTMEEGSFTVMMEAIRGLGSQSEGTPGRLAAVPELLRLVLDNPSALVRAEALRAAWTLSSGIPVEAWRTDAVDREEFNRRTQRLEELVTATGPAGPETLELARWLGAFRVPPESPDHLSLAVSVAEVVVSQALWRQDALGGVFRAEMPGSLHHALSVVTQHAAGDAYPVVREEALLSARHLHPDVALRMVTQMLQRESDAAVVLAALDSLEQLASRMDAGSLRPVLAPLAGSSDVAVRKRIRELLREPAG
jgi:HEAT repeat protein